MPSADLNQAYAEGFGRLRARVAKGKERSRLLARADEVNQGQYGEYQSRTSRVIPVVVLDRIKSRRSGRTRVPPGFPRRAWR